MFKDHSVKKISLAVALAISTCAAEAQPAADDEIIVTSPRVDTPINEAAGAISRVTQDQIQLGQQQLTLDESLTRVPGVFMQNRYNFSQALRVSIRGFGARSPFGIRGIKLMIDGVPTTLPDGQGNVDEIDLGSAERIEVIRGPAGSLYGSAAAGVISVYTEDGLETPFAEARLSGGEYGYEQLQFKVGGQAGDLNYLGSVSILDNEGYRDNSYIERRLLNTKFRYDLNESSDLTATINLVDVPKMGDPGALNAGEVATNPRLANPGALTFDGSEGRSQERLGLVYRNQLGTNHELILRNYYTWLDFENKLPFTGGVASSNGGQVVFDRSFAGVGGQYTYTGDFAGHPNRLVVGVDIDSQEDDRQRYANLPGGVRGVLTLDQLEEVSSAGIFAQNEFTLTDTIGVIAGLRYDQIDFDITDRFLANNSGDDSGSSDFSEVSQRLALTWAASDRTNVYVNYSTAFETPTTTEFANPNGGGFNPDLDSQTATSIEAGVKGVFMTRIPLSYDLATFHVDVEDELVPYEVDGFTGRTFYQNAGESTRDGFEAAISADLTSALSISFAYTYLNAEFDRFETSTENFDGSEIPGVPGEQVYLELNYQSPRGWYGVLDALYVADFYADNANTVTAPSYLVSSMRLGYQGQLGGFNVSPFLGISNLFDEDYFSNIRINAGFGRYYEPAPTRSAYAGVTLRYDFGG